MTNIIYETKNDFMILCLSKSCNCFILVLLVATASLESWCFRPTKFMIVRPSCPWPARDQGSGVQGPLINPHHQFKHYSRLSIPTWKQ